MQYSSIWAILRNGLRSGRHPYLTGEGGGGFRVEQTLVSLSHCSAIMAGGESGCVLPFSIIAESWRPLFGIRKPNSQRQGNPSHCVPDFLWPSGKSQFQRAFGVIIFIIIITIIRITTILLTTLLHGLRLAGSLWTSFLPGLGNHF